MITPLFFLRTAAFQLPVPTRDRVIISRDCDSVAPDGRDWFGQIRGSGLQRRVLYVWTNVWRELSAEPKLSKQGVAEKASSDSAV